MARRLPRRRALGAALLLALLAAPFGAAARAPEWEAGDVEAAERYRALERERALRFRAEAERRVADPRGGERAHRRERRDRFDDLLPERDDRPRRLARPPGRSSDEPARAAREPGREAPESARRWEPGWLFGDEPVFEPWVTRLAQAWARAVAGALERAASDAWWALRDAVEAWLDELRPRERPTWTEWRGSGGRDADWRPE